MGFFYLKKPKCLISGKLEKQMMLSKQEINPKAKNVPTNVKGMCPQTVAKHTFRLEDTSQFYTVSGTDNRMF